MEKRICALAAALILADKSDVRRSRVRNQDPTTFDIHDRVNYSVEKSRLHINTEKTIIKLKLQIDPHFSSVMDYFEIFLTRMVLCRKAAEKLGCVIKLIAWMKRGKDGSVAAGVEPCLVPKANQLASVDDVFNAVLVKGDMLGDVVFYGKGAGKLPTASAVVADVIDEVKHLRAHKYLCWDAGAPDYATDYGLRPVKMLLRVRADADRKADIAAAFGDIAFVDCDALPQNELAFLTNAVTEKELRDVLAAVAGIELVSRLRLAEL